MCFAARSEDIIAVTVNLGHSGYPKTARLAFDPGTASGYSTHALHHASLVCEDVTIALSPLILPEPVNPPAPAFHRV
jgi:hypothetical protein